MSLYALLVDTANGRRKARIPGPDTDQDFVLGAPAAEVIITSFTLTATGKLDVYINGQLTREGGSFDWTRDVGNSKILFNYTVPLDAWIRVRLW